MMEHSRAATSYYFLLVLISICMLCQSSPVGNCDSSCHLPECQCLTNQPPKGVSRKKIPQIILVTFDDGLTEKNIGFYRKLSNSGLKNPNGCPMSFTFFISGENNYHFAKEMYENGHEIACHSLSHKNPRASWRNMSYDEYINEMTGIKNNLVKSGIPGNKIKGFRSPFLQMGGNNQFDAVKKLGFSWDSSIVMGPDSDHNIDQFWPYTLDTPLQSNCEQELSGGYPGRTCVNKKCPTKSYPGLWEIPVNRWYDKNKNPCSLFDGCYRPRNFTEFSKFLMDSFDRSYNTNRAPAPFFMHVNFFLTRPYIFEIFKEYLENVSKMQDVWVLSISKALEWIKNPKELNTSFDVSAWNC
ncbi:uncharacterized protein LOC115211111 [Argonauta hians]